MNIGPLHPPTETLGRMSSIDIAAKRRKIHKNLNLNVVIPASYTQEEMCPRTLYETISIEALINWQRRD